MYEIPSDTYAAIMLLQKRYGKFMKNSVVIPLILVHQIYSILPDRTMVDSELEECRKNQKVRLLKLSISNCTLVALEEDFRKYILQYTRNLDEVGKSDQRLAKHVKLFHDSVLEKCSDVIISKKGLFKLYRTHSERHGNLDISRTSFDHFLSDLLHHGILVRNVELKSSNDPSFSFSLPRIGEYISGLLQGRKVLTTILKRTKYKEILESKLLQKEKSDIRNSSTRKRKRTSKTTTSKVSKLSLPYGMSFHVDDVVGAGIARSMNTPMGKLVKLTD